MTDGIGHLVGEELKKPVLYSVLPDGTEVPYDERDVQIAVIGRLVGIERRLNGMYAAVLAKSNGDSETILVGSSFKEARDKVLAWAGEPVPRAMVYDRNYSEGVCLRDCYCLGRSDVEVKMVLFDRYDEFRRESLELAEKLKRRYENG